MNTNTPHTYVTSSGTSLTTLLTVLFVALKLTGVIHWSWWWVLSPIWISFGLFIVIIVVLLLIALLVGALSVWFDKK